MLRYRVSGEIFIETEDTMNGTRGRQFINKKKELQEIVKQFIEREL